MRPRPAPRPPPGGPVPSPRGISDLLSVYSSAQVACRRTTRVTLVPSASTEPAAKAATSSETPTEPPPEPTTPHGAVGCIRQGASCQSRVAVGRGRIRAARPRHSAGDRVRVTRDRITGTKAGSPSRHGSTSHRSRSITPRHRLHLLSVRTGHVLVLRDRSIRAIGYSLNAETHSSTRKRAFSSWACSVKSWQSSRLLAFRNRADHRGRVFRDASNRRTPAS